MKTEAYTLGTGYDCARNHAICDGPHIVACVTGGGYPIGLGWSPKTEAIARVLAAAPAMLEALRTIQEHAAAMAPDAKMYGGWFAKTAGIAADAIALAEGRA